MIKIGFKLIQTISWLILMVCIFSPFVTASEAQESKKADTTNASKSDTAEILKPDSIRTPRRDVFAKTAPVSLRKSSTKEFGRDIINNAFTVGENLQFRIRYGPVVAGTSRMGVDDTVRVQGNLCFKIVTEAFSNKFFSAFFKVEDKVISYIDQKGLFTWYFEQHLREGKYRADRWSQYDQRANLVYTHKKDTLSVPPYVNDVLSSFYFVRTQKLEVGDTLFIQNHSERKIFPMAVLVLGREKIKIQAGKFRCLVVEPIAMEAGLFKSEGKLTVWLTDDEKRVPVQMKSKVSFLGSITAELTGFKGINKKELATW